MSAPIFYLLAGPNGAGKSTLYKALTRIGTIDPSAEFVNADLYEAAYLQNIQDPLVRSLSARNWADARRSALLLQKQSFASETVFSHESKIDLIDEAKMHGFQVLLFVVGLDDPSRLLARVAQRVKEGGHDVPADRILARYPRTLANLRPAVRKASAAFLYDSNEDLHASHELVAICLGDVTQPQVSPLPQWAKTVLGLG
jgi:predicted ABC-type ATPase